MHSVVSLLRIRHSVRSKSDAVYQKENEKEELTDRKKKTEVAGR
jgi:hypothetical protein